MTDEEFDSHNAGPSPHPKPWTVCASTHCERSGECRSPHDCLVRHGLTSGRTKDGLTQRERDDAAWAEDAVREGWTLDGIRASRPWRLWGVRHVRFVWHLARAEHRSRLLSGVGIGVPVLAPFDRWMLHAILRGWA